MFGPSKYPGSNIGGSNAWSGNQLGVFTSETRKKRAKPSAPIVPPPRQRPARDSENDVDDFNYGPA